MSESKSLVISTIVMAVATCVAVAATIWGIHAQHEDARELLQAQISAELDKQFDSTEMRRARKAFAIELLKDRHKLPAEDRVLSFFEKVGAYQRLGRIDEETTFSAFSYSAERYWAACRDAIKAFRQKERDNDYYGDFEELNDGMIEQEASSKHRKVSDVVPAVSEVDEFLKGEASLVP